MPKNSPKKTIADLFAADAIEVKVGDKTHKYSITELYKDLPNKAEVIQDKITAACKDKDSLFVEEYLQKAQQVFEERAVAKTRYENVLKEELRIREQELKPYKFDLKGLVARQEGEKPDLTVAPRISGATPEEFEAIMDGKTTGAFISAPDKFYRNAVFDAEVPARDGIRLNNKRLEVFLAEQRTDLTPKEEAECKKHSEFWHKSINAGQFVGAGLLDVARDRVLRGILSKTNAEDTSDYNSYSNKRNDAIYDMLYKACPREHRAAYFNALKSRNAVLRNSGDANSIAMADAMDGVLDQMLEEAAKEDKKRLEELQQKIEKGNETTLDGLQGHVNKEDDAHKFAILYAFLILGPFASGLAVAPILGSLLGPVFAGGSFAQGVAALSTNPLFGVFGKLAKICHLPHAIEWVMGNVPVIEQLTEVMEFATRNPVSAGIIEQMMPLAASPIVALGIAGLAASAGVSDKYLRYSEKEEYLKKQSDALKTLKKAFNKSDEEIEQRRSQDFVNRKMAASKNSYKLTKYAEFVAGASDEELETLKITFGSEEFAKMEKKTPEKVMRLLMTEQKNPELANMLMENFNSFVLYESAGRNLKTFSEIAETTKQAAIEGQNKKFEKECIFKMAADGRIEGLKTNSEEENLKFFESKLITRELEKIKDVSFVGEPSSVVRNPKIKGPLMSRDDIEIGRSSGPLRA